jgi:aminoglycoside phosphotransferase (APT) family kinase protein
MRQPLRAWETSEPTHAGADPLAGPADPESNGTQAANPARATTLAVECRTPDGLVDQAALTRFIEYVPRLDCGAPGGAVGALTRFTADALGLDGPQIVPVGGGAGKGQSGAPVYLVRNESGQVVAVSKIFPSVEEMVRELSALDRLSADEFQHFRVPEARGVAVIDLPDGVAGALVMSLAPGRSLFDMISEAPTPGSPDRSKALTELKQAVADAAVALAELHSRPAGSGGPVDAGFLKFNHALAQREAAAVAANGDVLAEMGVDIGEMRRRVDEAVTAALADPGGSAILHGDAHPGNIFWDPTHGVTLIDTPHCHFSMNDLGKPIGSPARDVSNMMERLAHLSREARYEWSEVQDLQSTFMEAYVQADGPAIIDPTRTAFTARFALRDVLDTLNTLEERNCSGESSELLWEQLDDEITLLRGALRWEA